MSKMISEPNNEQIKKYDELKNLLQSFGSAAVSFSGGVD